MPGTSGAIFTAVSPITAVACCACAATAALAAPLAQAARPPATQNQSSPSHAVKPRELLRSRELWATIDVCNTAKQPDTIGVRGSMPGDGRNHDVMTMTFHLQYLNAVNQWVELGSGQSSAPVIVGGGETTRQGGWSFTIGPRTGKSLFTLRGIVDFKWMHGNHVLQSARKPTTVGHEVREGAEPKGYSTASCSVG